MTLKNVSGNVSAKTIYDKFVAGPSCVLIGDSLSAGQPATNIQDWDNGYYGILRKFRFAPIESFTVDHRLETASYTPSPDVGGEVTFPTTASHTYKKPNASGGNTWSPGGIDEGALGWLSGLEIQGLNTVTANIVDVTWALDAAAFAGTAINPVLNSDNLYAGLIDHRHTNGLTSQLILTASGQSSIAALVDSSSGTGVAKTELGPLDSSGSPASLIIRNRYRAAEGDQTGKYQRIGHFYFRNGNVSNGLKLWGLAIGNSTLEEWTSSVASGGLFDDADFAAYLTLVDADTAIVWLGQNNSGETKAALKTKFGNLLTRLNGRGITDILTIGTFWNQAVGQSEADVIAINEACQEASEEHVGANVVNVSLLAAMDGNRISSSLLEGDVHPNQAGADYLTELWQTKLNAAASDAMPRPNLIPTGGLIPA
jgi:hypothetical protein